VAGWIGIDGAGNLLRRRGRPPRRRSWMMVAFWSLWLPILVASVAVFVVSAVVWMALPYHKSDWKRLANEEAFLDAVRGQMLPAGMYMYPGCSPADMKSPEMKARFDRGPWGSLVVLPGKPNMGRSLSRWFLFIVVVAVFAAYVVGQGHGAGAEKIAVFRCASSMAWIVFGGSAIPGFIWEGKPGSYAAKGVFDGLLYALTIGAVFAWMWPHA
jgi:hypothetical protein